MNHAASILVLIATCIFIIVDSHETVLCLDLCPPCPDEEPPECPSISNCPYKVKEPGCGCCMECALEEGERCGINKPSCHPGLKCEGSLSTLIKSKGVCRKLQKNQADAVHTRRTVYRRRRYNKSAFSKKRRRFPRHPHHGLLSPLNADGPCSRHYEALTTSCKALQQSVWFPSCDVNGYYLPKQCMTSTSDHRLGWCWCVNKFGTTTQKFSTDSPCP